MVQSVTVNRELLETLCTIIHYANIDTEMATALAQQIHIGEQLPKADQATCI